MPFGVRFCAVSYPVSAALHTPHEKWLRLLYTKCMCSLIAATFYEEYSDVGTLGCKTAVHPKVRKNRQRTYRSFIFMH